MGTRVCGEKGLAGIEMEINYLATKMIEMKYFTLVQFDFTYISVWF